MERAPPPPYSEAIHYQQSYVPSVTSATADNEPGDQTRESEASDNAVSNALPPSYSESNIQYGVDSASPEDPLIPQANNNRNTAEVNSSARDQEEPPPSYQAPHAQVIVGYSSQSSSGVTYTFTPAQPQYATGHYYAHTPKTLVGGQTPYSLAPYPSSFYPSQDVNTYNGSYQGYPPQVNPACNFNPQTPAANVQGYSTTPLAYGHQVSSDRDKNSQAKLFCLCACIGIVAIMIIMPYYMGLYQNT